ncbi:hypothetical protein [Microbacterium sp. KHB019]|uniref:hypothetical protein n=1 Tax=Microbacterium sp. KHB019 TaxID=3129770 RepID=UPI0030793EE0
MPTLYITGLSADGRSRIAERREIDPDGRWFEALRLADPVTAITSSSPEVALFAAPTVPGGLIVNIYPWRAGQRTPMHRTVTTDIDVVIQGSLTMHLEEESVELTVGDCAILPGVAHAWESGPEGAIAMYCLVAGEATGSDIGRHMPPLL